jgi:capsular polysaccharide transport system permease protein
MAPAPGYAAAPAPSGSPMPRRAMSDSASRPQLRRRRNLRLSALICVALPTLLAAVYYGLFAAPQYAVEVRFAVRSGTGGGGGGDLIGAFAGVAAPGSTITDSFIVIDYLKSREVIDKLEPMIGLRSIYASEAADWWARFDPSRSAEEFVLYWRNMMTAYFDNTSQIVSVEVRAFTPEDARQVATSILEASEQLINELSTRARADAVKSAQAEVQRMEELLKKNRAALSTFRDTKQEFDPVKQVEARYSILSKIEQQLSASRAKLASMLAFMKEEAPSVTFLKSEIKALEQQLEDERAKLGNKGVDAGQQSLGGLVANYEELLVDREFSEKAYVSALASLEQARAEADRQQRYVAAFVRPTLPEIATYPRRFVNVLTTLALSTVLWALGVLLTYAVRDHAL